MLSQIELLAAGLVIQPLLGLASGFGGRLKRALWSMSPETDNTEVPAVTHTSWQKAANAEERLGEQ